MKIVFELFAGEDNAQKTHLIRLYPENNTEMRNLDLLNEKCEAPYLKKCYTPTEICYNIVFHEDKRMGT